MLHDDGENPACPTGGNPRGYYMQPQLHFLGGTPGVYSECSGVYLNNFFTGGPGRPSPYSRNGQCLENRGHEAEAHCKRIHARSGMPDHG